MKVRDNYHIYALITIIFWSLGYVLTRLALQYFSAYSLGFLRYATASLVLIFLAAAAKMRLPAVKDLKWFLASGTAGFFLYMIAFNSGSVTVTAATSSVIVATAPVMTTLLARIIYKEKILRVQWVAIAIELLGVIVLTIMESGLTFNSGLLWLFGAALLLSIYNLLQRKLTQDYSAMQITSVSIFIGTIMLSIFSPISVRELPGAPAAQIASVICLGVFCSAVAYFSWSKAFEKAHRSSAVSNYMFLTPFLASILGIALAQEPISSSTIVGGMIIIAGLLLYNFSDQILACLSRFQM